MFKKYLESGFKNGQKRKPAKNQTKMGITESEIINDNIIWEVGQFQKKLIPDLYDSDNTLFSQFYPEIIDSNPV